MKPKRKSSTTMSSPESSSDIRPGTIVAASSPEPSLLEKLPKGLLTMILEEVIPSKTLIAIPSYTLSLGHPPLIPPLSRKHQWAILFANKSINREALSIFYSKNTFRLSISLACPGNLKACSPFFQKFVDGPPAAHLRIIQFLKIQFLFSGGCGFEEQYRDGLAGNLLPEPEIPYDFTYYCNEVASRFTNLQSVTLERSPVCGHRNHSVVNISPETILSIQKPWEKETLEFLGVDGKKIEAMRKTILDKERLEKEQMEAKQLGEKELEMAGIETIDKEVAEDKLDKEELDQGDFEVGNKVYVE